MYSFGSPEAAGEISDFVTCVQREKPERFTTGLWLFGDVEKKSAAEHILEVTKLVCRDYAGKGDKSGKPLRVLSKSEWSSFDAERKEIYIIAYLEMAHHLEKLSVGFARALVAQGPLPDTAAVDALHIAIAAVNGMHYLLTWNCTHIAKRGHP